MNLRWIVGGAAWVAFAAAVWFVGDMFGPLEGTVQRIALIVLVGAVFVAWEIWRLRRAAQENEQLLSGLVGGSLRYRLYNAWRLEAVDIAKVPLPRRSRPTSCCYFTSVLGFGMKKPLCRRI